MLRLYMSADGEGRPDWAWMAAFVWVLISRYREVRRLPAPRLREPRSEPPRFAQRHRCARRTSCLSTSGPESPRRRAGPAGRRAPGTRAAGPGPSPTSRHPPPRRAVRGALPSIRNPTSACLLLSTDVSRSTVSVSRNEKPHRQRFRAHIGRKRHGKAVRADSCRGAAAREPATVPAATSSPIPAGAQQPPTGRIPCPEGLGAHAGFHAARLRPFDPKPALALLGRAGSHAGGRPARVATLFRVLRPMRSAREQREKLPSGDFYIHARLLFLPCRHARAACDSRGARHATGAGLRV